MLLILRKGLSYIASDLSRDLGEQRFHRATSASHALAGGAVSFPPLQRGGQGGWTRLNQLHVFKLCMERVFRLLINYRCQVLCKKTRPFSVRDRGAAGRRVHPPYPPLCKEGKVFPVSTVGAALTDSRPASPGRDSGLPKPTWAPAPGRSHAARRTSAAHRRHRGFRRGSRPAWCRESARCRRPGRAPTPGRAGWACSPWWRPGL